MNRQLIYSRRYPIDRGTDHTDRHATEPASWSEQDRRTAAIFALAKRISQDYALDMDIHLSPRDLQVTLYLHSTWYPDGHTRALAALLAGSDSMSLHTPGESNACCAMVMTYGRMPPNTKEEAS